MTYVNSPAFAFTFGTLNLIGTEADLAANGFRFWVLDEDGDLGNPQAIEQTIQSFLQDGSIVALQGYDNREIFIPVLVEGTNGTTLAAGEAALMLQTGKRNTLVYQPADGTAPASVFTVITSKLEVVTRASTDITNERAYGIRITAEPFARASDLTTTLYPAPTGTPTITGLDITSSGTGWSTVLYAPDGSSTNPGLSGSPPPIAVVASWADPGLFTLQVSKTGMSQSLSATPFLRVRVTTTLGTGTYFTAAGFDFRVNGNPLTPVAQYGSDYWLDTSSLGAITLTDLLVGVTANWLMPPGTSGGGFVLRIEDVSRSDLLGFPSTTKQLSRTLAIGGSVRCEGNLYLADATEPDEDVPLGDVLVYTCPLFNGMVSPNLRQFLSSGNSASSASPNVTGVSTDISVLHTFDVPADGLAPGGFLLLARLKADGGAGGPQDFTWAARSRIGSNDLDNAQTGVVSLDISELAYEIYTVTDMVLPPHKMGPDGAVRIELTGANVNVHLDEAWLFNVETGQLTQVACGTGSISPGGSASKLWLDAPTIAAPEPAIFVGTDADRSNSYEASAQAEAVGHHVFAPPLTAAFVVTTDSAQADLTLSNYRRAHTHITDA